jgi:hypothetical protein
MAAGFGGGFHAVGFHGGGFGRGGFRATAAFVATGFGLVGFLGGGFYPGYYGGYYRGCYGYGSCYLIVYGTITAGCPGSIAVAR